MKNTGINYYVEEIKKNHTRYFTQEEITEYFKKIRSGDLKARDEFLCYNLRLVFKYAKEKTNRGIPFEDLVQYGNLGLIHAIDKYDDTQGTKFTTYAVYWIEAYITRALENYSKMIRYPAHYFEKRSTFRTVCQNLRETLDREPTVEEIAAEMKMTVPSILRFFEMDTPMGNMEVYMDNVKSKDDSASIFNRREFYSDLKKALQKSPFTKQEQEIFWKIMGLEEEEISMMEASRRYGLSFDQIKRRKISICKYLREDPSMISYCEKAFDEEYEKNKTLIKH